MLSLKMTEMWTTMGSTLASLMFIWAIIRQYCPYQLVRFFEKYSHRIMDYFYPYIRISFHEFLGDRLKRSDAYGAVEAYLSANTSKSAKRLKAEIGKDSTNLVLTMDEYERVTDDYKGVKVYWVCSKVMSGSRSMPYYQEQEKRFYKLTFHNKYRDTITGSYLDHVMKEGKEIRLRNRQRKLYTNSPGYKWPSYKQTMWSHIVFEHPATFETMAMEPEKKKEIIEDLVTFSKSKDFYARIGKAWKRGYLLFGPPGQRKKKGESKFFSDDENENKVNIDVLRKELISEVKITPADVAENLMPKSPMDDADKCLSNLIEALEEMKQSSKIKEQDEEVEHIGVIKENGEFVDDDNKEIDQEMKQIQR
ncbi:hypothetical protein P8452_76764 [Trifolium repens]|nr:hypothetical protein P8452_76764 [Trifolium repens]